MTLPRLTSLQQSASCKRSARISVLVKMLTRRGRRPPACVSVRKRPAAESYCSARWCRHAESIFHPPSLAHLRRLPLSPAKWSCSASVIRTTKLVWFVSRSRDDERCLQQTRVRQQQALEQKKPFDVFEFTGINQLFGEPARAFVGPEGCEPQELPGRFLRCFHIRLHHRLLHLTILGRPSRC